MRSSEHPERWLEQLCVATKYIVRRVLTISIVSNIIIKGFGYT